jgi:DnaJ-class molecular chaperone
LLSDATQRARFDRGEIDASGAPVNGQPARGSRFRSKVHEFVRRQQAAKSDGSVRVRGADVSYGLSVDFLEAAQGTTKRVSMTNGNRLDVRVPPGTIDGQVLRLRGQGMPGVGGAVAGDALVEIRVRPDPRFRRDGMNIHHDLRISIPEAVQGAKVPVSTVSGMVTVTVPPGSNSGTVLRLRGKGLPGPDGSIGDQLVTLVVVLPDPSDTDFAEFVRRWSPKAGYDPRTGTDEPAVG